MVQLGPTLTAPPSKENNNMLDYINAGRGIAINVMCDDVPSLDIFDNGSPFVQELGQYGITLQVPELREFLADSVYFRRMDASVAQCKPSRAAQLWGAHPGYTKCWSNSAGQWHRLVDGSLSLPAVLKSSGFQTFGIGKLFHEPQPNALVKDPAFDEYHIIPEGALRLVSVASQAGISGSANQVIENIPVTELTKGTVPSGTTDENGEEVETDGSGGFVTVTLNSAGSGIETVTVTQGPDKGELDSLLSGRSYGPGGTLEIEVAGGSAVLNIDQVSNYFQLPGANNSSYGVWSGDPRGKGDVHVAETMERLAPIIADSTKPRAVWLGLKAVHTPLVPQQEFLDRHPLGDIEIPDNWAPASSWVLRYISEFKADTLVDNGNLNERLQHFAAAFEEFSYNFGRIIQSLKDVDIYDDSVVTLWSDHGYMHGDRAYGSGTFKGALEKGLPYGVAARCLCAMRAPGLNSGVSNEPVSAVDVYPTVLELLGIDIPPHVQGQSLVPAMRRPNQWKNARGAPVWTLGNVGYVAQAEGPSGREPFRYIRWFNGEEELYCDSKDPTNRINLFSDPDYAAPLASVKAGFDAELQRLGAQDSDAGGGGDEVFKRYAAATVLTALQGGRGDDTSILGDEDIEVRERVNGGYDVVLFQPDGTNRREYVMPPDVEAFFSDNSTLPPNVIASPTGAYIGGRLRRVRGRAGDDVVIQYYAFVDDLTADGGGGHDLIQGAGGDDVIRGDGDVLVPGRISLLPNDGNGDPQSLFVTPVGSEFTILLTSGQSAGQQLRIENIGTEAVEAGIFTSSVGRISDNLRTGDLSAPAAGVGTAQFQDVMGDCIVFASIVEADGPESLVALVDDVTSTRVQASLGAPIGTTITQPEDIRWCAVTKGRHVFNAIGDEFEAGTKRVRRGDWKKIRFSRSMANVPVIVAQVQEKKSGNLVLAAVRNITADSFEVSFQPEPGATDIAPTELVGWMAIPPVSADGDEPDSWVSVRHLGFEGNDTLRGLSGDDDIKGDGGNDSIEGGNGNDTASGGTGDDTIRGGSGNDDIVGDAGNDNIEGGSGDDSLRGGSGDDSVRGGDGNDTIDGSSGLDTLLGLAGDDLILGGGGNDLIESGTGDDTATGGDGDNTIQGGMGDDSLSAEGGNDLINGGDGNDTIDGEEGENTLTGGDGDDLISSGNGNDLIESGTGDDTAMAGSGDDTVQGGMVSDSLSGGGGADVISGGEGNDTIEGDGGNDTLTGGLGNDLMSGGAARDSLVGGGGDDTLSGGAGDDTLEAGAGDVMMSGGDGADVYRFGASVQSITITDFSPVDGDTIDIDSGATGLSNFSQIQNNATDVGPNLLLTAPGTGGTVTINGFNVADLDASWFTFFGAE